MSEKIKKDKKGVSISRHFLVFITPYNEIFYMRNEENGGVSPKNHCFFIIFVTNKRYASFTYECEHQHCSF